MFNTGPPSSGELELWFIAFCGFLWYKYSHQGQSQFPNLTSLDKELGRAAQTAHYCIVFPQGRYNLRSIDNSEVWSSN